MYLYFIFLSDKYVLREDERQQTIVVLALASITLVYIRGIFDTYASTSLVFFHHRSPYAHTIVMHTHMHRYLIETVIFKKKAKRNSIADENMYK